jgi:hypothetical protein
MTVGEQLQQPLERDRLGIRQRRVPERPGVRERHAALEDRQRGRRSIVTDSRR